LPDVSVVSVVSGLFHIIHVGVHEVKVKFLYKMDDNTCWDKRKR